jgi:hypothetical protein
MSLEAWLVSCWLLVSGFGFFLAVGQQISLPTPLQRISFYKTVGLPTVPHLDEVKGSVKCSFEAATELEHALKQSVPADCNIEANNQILVKRWFKSSDVILETGARFGTTSCGIAEVQGNSGNLISVEPDQRSWHALTFNRHTHNCNFWLVQGVISDVPVTVATKGYATRTKRVLEPYNHTRSERESFTFEEIQTITGLQLTALMIDCEGCIETLFLGNGNKTLNELLQHVNTIILEGDMPIGAPDCSANCVNYSAWHERFELAGLKLVEKMQEKFEWIQLFVYSRNG